MTGTRVVGWVRTLGFASKNLDLDPLICLASDMKTDTLCTYIVSKCHDLGK